MAIGYGGSWVDISNRALARVKMGTIQSLTSESANKEAARQCALMLGEAIGEVYGSYEWKSATKTVLLARLTKPPVSALSFAYRLPADLVRSISFDTGGMRYVLKGSTIETDAPSVSCTYIAKPEDPSEIPEHLKKALVVTLAALLAYPLTSSEFLLGSLMNEKRLAIEEAKTRDQAGTDDSPAKEAESGWYDEAR